MKKKRLAEEQMIAVLQEQEAGMKTGDLARKHGISEATLYNWKAKYGGMDVSDSKRLKALEDENGKLFRCHAFESGWASHDIDHRLTRAPLDQWPSRANEEGCNRINLSFASGNIITDATFLSITDAESINNHGSWVSPLMAAHA